MPLIEYPDYEFNPRTLSKEEVDNPEIVLDGLFDFAHLPQIRELMREFLKTTVCGSWDILRPSERADILYFYEKLEKLVEASHLIYNRGKRKKTD